MFLAELAILFHFDAVGSILFVFVSPVVAVFAFGTGQGDISPHGVPSLNSKLIKPLCRGVKLKIGGGARI